MIENVPTGAIYNRLTVQKLLRLKLTHFTQTPDIPGTSKPIDATNIRSFISRLHGLRGKSGQEESNGQLGNCLKCNHPVAGQTIARQSFHMD